jgi:hypothetical protein
MILTGENRVWRISGMILTGENRVWSNSGMILTGENRVWSIGGMILTGENRSTGRKPCYSKIKTHYMPLYSLATSQQTGCFFIINAKQLMLLSIKPLSIVIIALNTLCQ